MDKRFTGANFYIDIAFSALATSHDMAVPNLTNSMGVDLLEFKDALSTHLERWRVVRAMVDGKYHISFEVPAFYCQGFNSDGELSRWLCQQARNYADESKSTIGDGTYVRT